MKIYIDEQTKKIFIVEVGKNFHHVIEKQNKRAATWHVRTRA